MNERIEHFRSIPTKNQKPDNVLKNINQKQMEQF